MIEKPTRLRNETPIEYHDRTGCVDDRYWHKHKGLYYCNPAHCHQTWEDKQERNKHLDIAYAMLR